MGNETLIMLPKASSRGAISLEEAIARRRSQRSFADRDLTQQQYSQLLWSAQGITGKKAGYSFRSSPSAGALYPMELYCLDRQGLFHYLPEKHAIEKVASKDLRRNLAHAAFGQDFIAQAPFSIVICCVFERISGKYGERGRQYSYIEAGHIAQNIHLQAVALGLGSVPVGAFDDTGVQRLLGLPDDRIPLYIIPVGYEK